MRPVKKPAALKKAAAAAVLILMLAAFCGSSACLKGVPVSKKLTEYYSGSRIVAARFYSRSGEDGYFIEELPAESLPALAEKLGEMKLSRHSFHTDYFWGGTFGIELEYEDGTFVTYDGTKALHRSASMKDSAESDKNLGSGDFLEVTNLDFWDEMKPFFPSAENFGVHSSKY